MKIRGNYHLFYALYLISGIIMYFASLSFGDIGFGLGTLPAVLLSGLVTYKHMPDERELSLYREIDSYVIIGIAFIMTGIYAFLPDINWFHALVSATFALRGAIGLIMFSIK